MKNKKVLEFTLESLVHETFDMTEPRDLKGLKLEFNTQLNSYRLSWHDKIIDFPKGLAIIEEAIRGSYLDLKTYDCELYNGLREFLNTSEDIYFYVFGDDLFLSFEQYSDIKKAA